MNADIANRLYSLCLPGTPFGLGNTILKQDARKNKTLFLLASDVSVKLALRSREIRKKVVEFFLKNRSITNCRMLRKNLDVFKEVFDALLSNEKGRDEDLHIGIFKNDFGVYVRQRLVLRVQTKEQYPTDWPFVLMRQAFLNNLKFINVTFDGEGDISYPELTEKVNEFLGKFERRQVPPEDRQRVMTYQIERIHGPNMAYRVMFIGRFGMFDETRNFGFVI